jgi:hypothetical protein
MPDAATRSALKKLREDCARLEAPLAEVMAHAKTEQEARDIYLRYGIDEDTASIFAGMHGERLAAQQAEKRPAQKAA